MPHSTLSAKGQTTVPREVRERLGLRPGDRIAYVVELDGRVRIEPANLDVRALKGCLVGAFPRPLSVEAMQQAIRQRHRRA